MELPPLTRGRLLRRRKRFLADVLLDAGAHGPAREVIAWCPNPGRMTTCMGEGWPVWLSRARPGRKLDWTWELSRSPEGATILVNTTRPNAIVAEALAAHRVPQLAGYADLAAEVRVEDSRLDFALDGHPDDPRRCFVEVKSVTLRVGPGRAAFPDAVTARGLRHLDRLASLAAQGHRAVLFFALGRDDVDAVRAAHEVDPTYAARLHEVAAAGVEVMAWRCRLDIDEGGRAEVQLAGAACWESAGC